jgi:hypothetical protein
MGILTPSVPQAMETMRACCRKPFAASPNRMRVAPVIRHEWSERHLVVTTSTDPIFPPSGPAQWLFQKPAEESKFLAANIFTKYCLSKRK